MATTKSSAQRGVDIYNAARANGSDGYRAATQDATVQMDFRRTMEPIVKYGPYMNEFLTFVVNKIAVQRVESKIYANRFAMLKKDGYPLGTDMEMNYVNPAMGRDYAMSVGDTLLNRTKADVKTCYFRVNRRRQFPITIPREIMEGAFTQWEQLDAMTNGIVQSMFSGNAIEEENKVIQLISDSVSKNVVKSVQITWDLTNDPAESCLRLGKLIQRTAMNMKHFGSDYNNWQAYAASQGIDDPTPAITWIDDNDYFIFIRTDALSEMNYEVLAAAFNLNKVELQGRIIEVPSFDYYNIGASGAMDFSSKTVDPSKIIAVIADRKTFSYSDQFQRTTDFYNGAGLYQNQYLTVSQTWGVLPWGNCLAICEQH